MLVFITRIYFSARNGMQKSILLYILLHANLLYFRMQWRAEMLPFITRIYFSACHCVQKSILLYILLHAIECNFQKSLILKRGKVTKWYTKVFSVACKCVNVNVQTKYRQNFQSTLHKYTKRC